MTNASIPVPCGKCPACLSRRVSAWSFRLMQEDKRAKSAYFVTLTYDTKFVPLTRSGYMTLNKPDVQKFFKRLRKSLEGQDIAIKYYLCGEYGGRTNRPHYHAIIFNSPSQSVIEQAWQLGAIHYGEVSEASVGYTLKYMSKPKKIPMHRNDDRLMEFSLMSKGLGLSYLNERTIAYHNADPNNRMCLTIAGGKKIAMPRYYKDKLWPDQVEILPDGTEYTHTHPTRLKAGLHLKQEVIRKEDELRAKHPRFDIDRAEQHIAAFRKMNKQSKTRDKL